MHRLPDMIQPYIKQITGELGLIAEPIMLSIKPESYSEMSSCFENVNEKIRRDGGIQKYGWLLHLEPYMIIAEFHAIWENPDGTLCDITPDPDETVSGRWFILDPHRVFTGERVENHMLNISGSILIDDYIELQRANYRFMETGGRENILGFVPLNYQDQIKWDILNLWSGNVLALFNHGIDSTQFCFCGRDNGYENCHRPFIKRLIGEI